MPGRLQDKVVIVTGASSGIGRAAAVRIAEEGGHAVLIARRETLLKEATDAINGQGLGTAEHIALDVSNLEAFAQTIRSVAERRGRLDGLVNNAVEVNPGGVFDTCLENWHRTFRVNVDVAFIGTKAALDVMVPQKRGSIVNIAATSGILAMQGLLSYSVSKAALIHLSSVLAIELAAYQIRVNAIAPGLIATPPISDFNRHDPNRATRQSAAIPLQRMGEAIEVANGIVYLLSDESAYTTGACLCIDGGKSVQLHSPE